MDREALARAARGRQVLEALEFERERETVLVEQLEDTVADAEGGRIDEAAYAGMSSEDVQIVRELLEGPTEEEENEEILLERDAFGQEPDEESVDEVDEEIARLEETLVECRRRQQAFERYLEALERAPAEADT